MILLNEIKEYFKMLEGLGIIKEAPSFVEIDRIAEACYNKKYKHLLKYTKKASKFQKIALMTKIKNIKKIVKDEHKKLK